MIEKPSQHVRFHAVMAHNKLHAKVQNIFEKNGYIAEIDDPPVIDLCLLATWWQTQRSSTHNCTKGLQRTMYTTYEKLYGLPPETVLRISHKPTLDILNTRASVVSSKYEMTTEKYCELFDNFLGLFKEFGDGYDQSYLDGDPTAVTSAYWAFLNCQKTEVIKC